MSADFDDEKKNTQYTHRCGACFGSGVRYLAMGGETPGLCVPILRHRPANYAYCYDATIPCDCDVGIHFATKKAKLANPEAATVTPTIRTDRWKWLVDNCVFLHPWACTDFMRQCREQREAARKARRATQMPRQATRDDKSDIDTALPLPRPEPTKSRPLERAVARAVQSIPVS